VSERYGPDGHAVIVVAPEGELDVYNSPQLKEVLERHIAQGCSNVVIDLARVTYMDSSALGLLVSQLKSLRKRSGQLKIASLRGSVEKIFQLTRLTKFFEIYPSPEEALSSFDLGQGR